jgi:hypothetical protein
VNGTPPSLLARIRESASEVDWRRLVDLYAPLTQQWLRHHGVPAADLDDSQQDTLRVIVREMPAFRHSQRAGAFRRCLRLVTVNRLRGY